MAEIQVGGSRSHAPEVNEKTPLHILLIGNFRGSVHDDAAKPVSVDRDNLYELPEQLGVCLNGILASADGQTEQIEFHEFEDFEPDELFEKLSLFENLRTLRRRLLNPKHFDSAAAEVMSWARSSEVSSAAEATEASGVSAAAPGSEDLFADVLSQSHDASGSPLETGNWEAFIQEVLAGSNIQKVDPRQDDLVALVDQAIEESMRLVLRSPKFRSLEMNWRGLRWLTFQIETHAKLKFYVLDISAQRFREALESDDWQSGWLAETITKPSKTPGAIPWGMVGCLFPLGVNQDDLILAAKLGDLCQTAGAAAAVELRATKPDWLEMDDAVHDFWQANRMTRPMLNMAGLWPRVQLRLPYGKKYKSTDRFSFEEISQPGGSQLAWGSPVWLACAAIAQGYNESGWGLDTSAVFQFGDLPLYYDPADNGDAYPCGEHLLTDEEFAKLMELGLSPVISFKNQDRVQVRGLQSMRGGKLQGSWS